MPEMNGPFGLGLLLHILFSFVSTKSGEWFLDIIHLGLGELIFTIFRYLFLRDEVGACMGGKGTVKELRVSFHLLFLVLYDILLPRG